MYFYRFIKQTRQHIVMILFCSYAFPCAKNCQKLWQRQVQMLWQVWKSRPPSYQQIWCYVKMNVKQSFVVNKMKVHQNKTKINSRLTVADDIHLQNDVDRSFFFLTGCTPSTAGVHPTGKKKDRSTLFWRWVSSRLPELSIVSLIFGFVLMNFRFIHIYLPDESIQGKFYYLHIVSLIILQLTAFAIEHNG